MSFAFFQKYIKLKIPEDPQLVLLITTLVEFQSLLIITYNLKKFKKGKCQPCSTKLTNLCCKQLKTCPIFQSAFNKNNFLIRHDVTCKSSCVIYLMKCSLWEKWQYVAKSQYSSELRMNTHRNDVWRTDDPPCDKNFQVSRHNFNAHAKFTIIEEVYNKLLSNMEIDSLLEHREDFRILNLPLFPGKV